MTRRDPRPGPAGVQTAALVVGLLCLWMFVQAVGLSTLSQDRAQELLHSRLRSELAMATAPLGPVTEPGAPVALLSIEQIGLEQVVVEGTSSGDLLTGPGHQRNTVLPGQLGTSVVMGRAATYGRPFARLGELRTGDEVDVVTAQGATTMRVTGVRRAGDPQPQPLAADRARLTLVSAEGSGRLGALRPGRLLLVDAEADGKPAPAGLPRAVPASEHAMASDTGALPLLVLHLAVLLVLALGVVAARQRWSAVTVWLVAAPLVWALAWSTTDVVVRLLPNLT